MQCWPDFVLKLVCGLHIKGGVSEAVSVVNTSDVKTLVMVVLFLNTCKIFYIYIDIKYIAVYY